MTTFGTCSLVESGRGTYTGNPWTIRVHKRTLSEDGLLSSIAIRLSCGAIPPPGHSNVKALIYNNNAGYPSELLGVSNIVYLTAPFSKAWVTFTFSPSIELPAGDYWIGAISDGGNAGYSDVQTTGTPRYIKSSGAGTYYTNPPNPYPAGASEDEYTVFECCTYTPSIAPYPTGLLKKDMLFGYHCFMNAYIKAKTLGYTPLKLPDGTTF
jgi:hypothetical protein